ncbi:MAG: PAS domain S-box protein [Candidatus Binatia bacterium]|nr:PAS domain S-box protein [Candidatus Binatia bacterium]
MEEQGKSKEQLLQEISALRQRVATLEIQAQEWARGERALRAAKKYAETLITSALDIIIACDAERKIVEFNPAAERAFGYDKAEVLGRPVELVYASPEESSRIEACIAADGRFVGEVANRKKNGEIFYCYLSAVALYGEEGRRVGVMGISRDITERKKAQETQARLVTILDATPDFVSMCDRYGRVFYLNPAGRKLIGLGDADEVTHTYIYDYHPEWVRALFSEILPQAMRAGVWSGETALLHRDGHEIPVSQVIVCHKGPDGTVAYFSTIMRDISEQRAMERQRAEFIAMLTHDIKNPLAAILGYVDLLHDEIAGRVSPEAEDFLQRLKDNALTIYSLITNYLDFARAEAGSLILCKARESIGSILRRVAEQYAAVARRRQLSLTVDVAADIPPIHGDALALERIFSNLIRNALKFTPEKGWVSVTARRLLEGDGHYVVVEVRDTGPGIAPEVLPTLFKRYRQAPTATRCEGTGLGLFIVKTLVEAHQGRVEVDSTVGVGTCMRVVLPAAPQEQVAEEEAQVIPLISPSAA